MRKCIVNNIREKCAQYDAEDTISNVYKNSKYVSIAIDDNLAFTVDKADYSNIVGILDSRYVDFVNSFRVTLRDGRLFVSDNETKGIVTLSVAIMCAEEGYFDADTYHVHHVLHCTDNRVAYLEKRIPYSSHPAEYEDEMQAIKNVLSEYGYTMEEVLTILHKKLDAFLRNEK